MKVAVADWLRGGVRLLRRRSGSLPPLTRRGQLFDLFVAVGLWLAAIQAGEDGMRTPANPDGSYPSHHDADEFQDSREQRVPVPDPGPYDAESPVPIPDLGTEPFLPIEQDQPGWAIIMLLVVLPLVFRRRYPMAMLWVVLAAAPLVMEYDAALRLSFYACVIAAYTAAVYSPYRVPALASLPVAALIYARLQESAVPAVPDSSVPFLILIPIAVVAVGLRRWKHRADEDRARLSVLEGEQAEALRRAAEHERARIARELHDVVTHNVSVMVIQAGAARKVMDAAPDQAREALLAVEAGGRAAMAELRHVMGLLTMDSDGADPASLADLTPQPGLDGLESLVQRVRDTGVPVELSLSGQPRAMPSGIELAAYRVVQEALTNTVKHAAGAAATVRIAYRPQQLRVEVLDTGGTSTASAATGNGHGLIGLRERLAVYGGTLLAGPRPTGGYRIQALFPLEAP